MVQPSSRRRQPRIMPSRCDKPHRGGAALVGHIAAFAVLVGWTAVCLVPLLWLLLLSVQQPIDIASGPFFLPFLDFWPSTDGWRSLFRDAGLDALRPLATSVVVTAAAALATVGIAAPAAYALAGLPARRQRGLLLACLVPRLLPPAALAGGMYLMARDAGLLDTRAVLILANLAINLPVAVWLLRNSFAAIPTELADAARIDGATQFTVFRRIALPLVRPGLAVALLAVAVLAWGEYPLASVVATDRAQVLPSLLVAMIVVREQGAVAEPRNAEIAAMVLAMAIPPVAAVLALRGPLARQLLAGIGARTRRDS
jgi:multiple sugar transport system permease protein